MQKTLEEMLAEAAIRDVQVRYCRAVDRRDFELLRSCFHDGATFDYGLFKGGVDEFIVLAQQSVASFTSTSHFTGNQLVEVSGDSAWSEQYVIANHRCPEDDSGPVRDFVTWIRYVDRFERRSGDWRMVTRHLILDTQRTDPVGEASTGPNVDGGRRARSDASHTRTTGPAVR